MALTPVQSTVVAGMLPNPPGNIGTAIGTAAALDNAVSLYLEVPVVAQFIDLLDVCSTNANSVTANLKTYGANIFPAAVDQLPAGLPAASVYPVPDFSLTEFYTLGQQVADETSNGSIYTCIVDFVTNVDPANLIQATGNWSTTIDGNKATLTDYLVTLNDRMTADATQYAQIFLSSVGYQSQSNAVLEEQQANKKYTAAFNPNTGGMNTLTTGSLNQFTANLVATSSDMSKLGQLISLQNLDDLGLPGELLAQIGRVSGGEIPSISSLLSTAGVSRTSITTVSGGTNNFSNQEEELAYKVMLAVTGDSLKQVLSVLGVTQTGFTTMAQLLDPQKIFPNSFQYLRCPSTTNLVNLYIGGGGTWAVNQNLRPLFVADPVNIYAGPNNTTGLEILSKITPPEVALANKAMARALQQISGIQNSNLPALSRAMALVETNSGLPLIENATQPTPPNVDSFISGSVANGTGQNGTVKVSDICGSPSGIDLTDEFSAVQGNLTSIGFTTLTANAGSPTSGVNGIYTYMNYALGTDDYNVPDGFGNVQIVIPAGPAAGTYPAVPTSLPLARAAAMTGDGSGTGLIPAASSALTTIVTNNASPVANITPAWTNIVNTLQRQEQNLARAEIDINNLLPDDRSTAMLFGEQTHAFGVDVAPGGANEILGLMAQTGNVSGQALIASLREGRNLKALGDAGLKSPLQP